jgi:hypothetical protein
LLGQFTWTRWSLIDHYSLQWIFDTVCCHSNGCHSNDHHSNDHHSSDHRSTAQSWIDSPSIVDLWDYLKHAWSYAQKGQLVAWPGAEHFEGIDETTLGLKPLPVTETKGLVVIGLQDDVTLADHLDPVSSAIAYSFKDYEHLETREFAVDANWKLVVDVNFEAYHFPALHKNSLHAIASNNASFDLFERHCRWAFPLRSIDKLRGLPEDQ